MHALEELEVNVHVEGHLAAALELLLLHAAFVEARLRDALSEQPRTRPPMRAPRGTPSPREQTCAKRRSGRAMAVEENLRGDVGVRDVLLEVDMSMRSLPRRKSPSRPLLKMSQSIARSLLRSSPSL